MEELGHHFELWINPLLTWIKADGVGPAIAAIIVVLGVMIISWSTIETLRELSYIKRTIAVLGKRSEEEFARDFNIIDQDLNEIPRISTVWSEFSETLISPRFDNSGHLISPCKNTGRPHTFFNVKELSLGPDFAKVFPSVFVGIGPSLTFLGLIAALNEAVSAIDASGANSASMQNAIANLLQISSAKFYASLFALFMSVVLTIALRLMSWSLSRSLSRVNQSIEAGVRYLSREQLSLDTNDILRNQLAQLQTFNTDLAMKIGHEVQSSLDKTLQPVISRLDSMGGDLTKANIDAIEGISKSITDSIQGAAGGSMDRVATILDQVSHKLSGLSEALTGALSNFDADFQKMLGGLKESLKTSTDGVAIDIGNSVEQMSSGVQATTEQVGEMLKELAATMSRLSTMGSEISQKGGETLRKQVEAASEQASLQLSQAGESLTAGFSASTETLVSALDMAAIKVSELQISLDKTPEKLEAVNNKLEATGSQILGASQQLGKASNGLVDVIQPLAEYAAETRGSVERIGATFESSAAKISTASFEINSAVTKLQSEVSAQIQRLDGADESLARLLIGIQNSTEQVLESIAKFVNQVDSGFASSVGILQESISEFEEVVDSVGSLVKQVKAI